MASVQEEGPKRAVTMEDAMKGWQSMAHVKWECKYHIVFIPKYRKKKLYGKVRKRIGEIFQELCRYRSIDSLNSSAPLRGLPHTTSYGRGHWNPSYCPSIEDPISKALKLNSSLVSGRVSSITSLKSFRSIGRTFIWDRAPIMIILPKMGLPSLIA